MNLAGKRVLVMGLGVHGGGLGVTRWLVKQGAQVTVTDLKHADELRTSLDALRGLPIRYVLGEHRPQDFRDSDLVVRGPGVPKESPFLAAAHSSGVAVEMEMGLFLERLPRGMGQVVGITGTKGKTTTTLMVSAILQQVVPKTVVAGNLRISALELLDRIDANTPVVLELSSWQLEAFEPHRASPHIAAITNITPDHLNRYRDLDEYAQSKTLIFRYQQPDDWVILNSDNSMLTRFGPEVKGRVVWTSTTRPLNQGAFRLGNRLMWRWQDREHKVATIDSLALTGRHNVENALIAIAVAGVWGASADSMGRALREFRTVEHRQELVREIAGVRYVNDTTATTPAAAIAALETLSADGSGIILVAGGADKRLDYADFARAIARHVKHVVLLEGSATDKLANALSEISGQDIIADRFDDLGKAIERASLLAVPHDVVLLSPGCASFGMFANEFERGNAFRQVVNGLNPRER